MWQTLPYIVNEKEENSSLKMATNYSPVHKKAEPKKQFCRELHKVNMKLPMQADGESNDCFILKYDKDQPRERHGN